MLVRFYVPNEGEMFLCNEKEYNKRKENRVNDINSLHFLRRHIYLLIFYLCSLSFTVIFDIERPEHIDEDRRVQQEQERNRPRIIASVEK